MSYDPSQQPQPGPFGTQQPPAGTGQPPATPQPAVPSFIPPTIAAAAVSPKPKRGVSAGTIAFVGAVVIAAAGLGFAGGRLTAPATPIRSNFTGQFGGNGGGSNPNASGNPNRGFGGGGAGFGGANITIDGQVTAISNTSITIQTANGQPVQLQLPSNVTYHAQASAAPTDVTVGSQVQVSVSRPNVRPDASGQPAPSGGPATGNGGGFQMTVTDITVLAK